MNIYFQVQYRFHSTFQRILVYLMNYYSYAFSAEEKSKVSKGQHIYELDGKKVTQKVNKMHLRNWENVQMDKGIHTHSCVVKFMLSEIYGMKVQWYYTRRHIHRIPIKYSVWNIIHIYPLYLCIKSALYFFQSIGIFTLFFTYTVLYTYRHRSSLKHSCRRSFQGGGGI